MKKSPIASTGIITAKASDILGLTPIAITSANISINGQRTAVLIIIINAICTLLTSVVSLVTRPAVENLSTFAKE